MNDHKVGDFKAEPNPHGGQIDLSWTNPAFQHFAGIKILRQEFAYPTLEEIRNGDGVFNHTVTEPQSPVKPGQLSRFSDKGLKLETVYYYAVAAYDDTAPTPDYYPTYVSALATTAYKTGAYLYQNLPTIYRSMDHEKGQLRRLVDMFGLQFDLLRSFASASRDFSDVERIDGELLELLAQWIGWQSGPVPPELITKLRNEIRYAPHFYRTTGVPANLYATLNRLSEWDVQIKEFVHSVFRSNDPERLTVWEATRRANVWQVSEEAVTLDLAYDGKPAAVQTHDERQWLFYHARQSPSPPRVPGKNPVVRDITNDNWHIWYKIKDENLWSGARRLTFLGDINKYPAVLQKSDKNIWLFWSTHKIVGRASVPQIQLKLLSAGRPARPARVQGTQSEPFTFNDGDTFGITVDGGIPRVITFRDEDFSSIGQVSAAEVVALLNREIPGAKAAETRDGEIILTSYTTGSESRIDLPVSAVATQLGLGAPVSVSGTDATRAELTGSENGTFALSDGDTISIQVDGDISQTITFRTGDFGTNVPPDAAQVAAVINRVLPDIASDAGGHIRLTSPTAGKASAIAVDVDASTAAPKLGFGAPLPAGYSIAADTEPAVFEDSGEDIWLFWSSRRTGRWKIWYNRFDSASASWGSAKRLTGGLAADRQCAVLFDQAGGSGITGRIWVFWSRKKANGLWNVFYRRTDNLSFKTHSDVASEAGDPHWTDVTELSPVSADYDNREPAALLDSNGKIELYFSSNRAHGWNIWSTVVPPDALNPHTQIDLGQTNPQLQFTHRAPVALSGGDQTVSLWFRSNRSQVYPSNVYQGIETKDARYAGSTTVDTRNQAKMILRRDIEDIQHYTYDTRKTDAGWYARDTVGVFTISDTFNPEATSRHLDMLKDGTKRFLPIQLRPVFINHPRADFRWARTWDGGPPLPVLPDLSVSPPEILFGLYHSEFTEGE